MGISWGVQCPYLPSCIEERGGLWGEILKTLLLTLALLAVDPSHKVHEYIRAVAPQIHEPRARDLAKLIYKIAKTSEIDPITLATIVRQESNFKADTQTCYIVYRHHTCDVTCDLGLAQINLVWVEKWGLSPCRLVYDDSYNLQVAGRILKALKNRYGMSEPLTWFSRYNSSSERFRQNYQERLNGFLVQRNGTP